LSIIPGGKERHRKKVNGSAEGTVGVRRKNVAHKGRKKDRGGPFAGRPTGTRKGLPREEGAPWDYPRGQWDKKRNNHQKERKKDLQVSQKKNQTKKTISGCLNQFVTIHKNHPPHLIHPFRLILWFYEKKKFPLQDPLPAPRVRFPPIFPPQETLNERAGSSWRKTAGALKRPGPKTITG